MAFNDGNCLWVRGIPPECQKEDLLKLFRSYGQVANAQIPCDPLTRCHKGYAFVTMVSMAQAKDCIQALHGAELGGHGLLVEMSKRGAAYAKTPGIYLGSTKSCGSALRRRSSEERAHHRPLEPGLLKGEEAAFPEPLSEPMSSSAFASAVEPVTEPGGEPLTEEDPPAEPPRCSAPRRCRDDSPPVKPKLEVLKSPRSSRISELEAANVRAQAQQTADSLLLQFQRQGFADSHAAAYQCLRTSLELLGGPSMPAKDARNGGEFPLHHYSAQALVSPDEFKNPSSFLRVYGDPLASSARRGFHGPQVLQDGNWRCENCSNINFPRRQRCNKCQCLRGASGDAAVLQYAHRVYEMLSKGRTCG